MDWWQIRWHIIPTAMSCDCHRRSTAKHYRAEMGSKKKNSSITMLSTSGTSAWLQKTVANHGTFQKTISFNWASVCEINKIHQFVFVRISGSILMKSIVLVFFGTKPHPTRAAYKQAWPPHPSAIPRIPMGLFLTKSNTKCHGTAQIRVLSESAKSAKLWCVCVCIWYTNISSS